MNCPKCKCPNPVGASFCEMCYEPFNRSAAENYIRTARRQRNTEIHHAQKTSAQGHLQHSLAELSARLRQWSQSDTATQIQALARRYFLAIAGGVVLSLALVTFLILHSPSVRFRMLGHRLSYLSTEKQQRYLVGFQTGYKCWSQRAQQMDTPIAEYEMDEIGNIFLETAKTEPTGNTLGLRAKEWIHIRREAGQSSSTKVDLQDPSLAPLTILLDRQGALKARPEAKTPRLGRALELLIPSFPTQGLRVGSHWNAPARWVESIGEWKIFWSGDLAWTMDSAAACEEGICVYLSYTGTLRPQLWAAPTWTAGALAPTHFDPSPVNGKVVFDVQHHRLLSNSLSYDALFHIPIKDLGLVPYELRVGRVVRGVPGEVVVQLTNQASVHKN